MLTQGVLPRATSSAKKISPSPSTPQPAGWYMSLALYEQHNTPAKKAMSSRNSQSVRISARKKAPPSLAAAAQKRFIFSKIRCKLVRPPLAEDGKTALLDYRVDVALHRHDQPRERVYHRRHRVDALSVVFVLF